METNRVTYAKLRLIHQAVCDYWRHNGSPEPSLALWMTDTTLRFADAALAKKCAPHRDESLETIARVLEIAASAGSSDLPRWFWHLEAALHMNERMLGARIANRSRKPHVVFDQARRRSRLCGAYSTPHYIAEGLIDDVFRAMGGRQAADLLDLSVEAGQFPVTTLAKAPLSKTVHFYALDRDPEALRMTRKHFRFAEHWIHAPELGSQRFALSLACRDSLLDQLPRQWPKQFDVIFGNPPWDARCGRYTEQLRAAFKEWLSDHFDHYLAFLLRAHGLLKPGGLLGVVVPSSFLFNDSAQKVRKLLLDHYDVCSLRIYPRASFIEIRCLVPVALVFRKKKAGSQSTRQSLIEYHPLPLGGPLKPRTSMTCNAVEHWKTLPGHPFHPLVRSESVRFMRSLSKLPTLAGYGRVLKGASTQKRDPVASEIDFVGFEARDIRPFHPCVRRSRRYSKRDARFQASPNSALINTDKVLFQNFRFVTHERRLIAAVGGCGSYPVGTASMFVPNGSKQCLFFAALLNSSVVNAWYKLRDVSRTIKLELIRGIPVPKDASAESDVLFLARTCSSLREQLHQIGEMCVVNSQAGHYFSRQGVPVLESLRENEQKLNRIFYELYRLSRADTLMVEEVADVRVF